MTTHSACNHGMDERELKVGKTWWQRAAKGLTTEGKDIEFFIFFIFTVSVVNKISVYLITTR